MSSTARGGVAVGARAMLVSQGIRVVLQLVGVAVLARLLSPDLFGVMAMVTVIVGFGEVVRDFGLSSAVVQAATLSRGAHSNLFWLNLAIGATLMLLLILGAPALGAIYGTDDVVPVARAVAPVFLLHSATAQYRAGLLRHLRFTGVAWAEVAGAAVGTVAAVVAAVAQAGVTSLVIQQLVTGAVGLAAMAWAARWVPSLPRRGRGTRRVIAFGANVFGTQLLGYATRNVDVLVLGRFAGATVTGLYSRAFQLVMLAVTQANAPVNAVALAVLSRVQDDAERFRVLLLRGQGAALALTGTVVSVIAAGAPGVVRVMLGPQWDGAVPIVRMLALAALFQGACYVAQWVFQASGNAALHLRLTLVIKPVTIVLIACGAMAWGPVGAAAGLGVGNIATWFVSLAWIERSAGIGTRALRRRGVIVSAVFVLAGGLATALSSVVATDLWTQCVVGIATTALVVAAGVRYVPQVREAFEAGLSVVWSRRQGAGSHG